MSAGRDRRSIRLPGYDYTQPGAYFVTLVAQGRADRFGQIAAGEISLTPAGEMLHAIGLALPNRFPNVELDEFVVMPNHVHGIIVIVDRADPVGAPLVGAQSAVGARPAGPSLGQIIGVYKSITTHEYILEVDRLNWPPFERRLWQRNYFEHILHTDADLDRVRAYIRASPLQSETDRENPAFIGTYP